jgi:hypothetical protein
MKERPILFNGSMVRALLDGSKTQTRRVVKPQPADIIAQPGEGKAPAWAIVNRPPSTGVCVNVHGNEDWLRSPYGQPGDRLWVRETWQGPLFGNDDMQAYQDDPESFNQPRYCQYAADGGPAPEFMTMDDELVCRWRPSIHVPRWASRILLEIVSVRVERLQDISEADARAEGITDGGCVNCGEPEPCGCPNASPDARDAYVRLWESINGAGSWDTNPWVWVVEFKRVAP